MNSLFDKETTEKTTVPDTLSIIARRKLGLSAAYTCCELRVVGTDGIIVTLKEEYVKSSGKNKGKRGWRGEKKVAIVTYSERDNELLAWEANTGKCSSCGGDGEQWYGWHHIEGAKYRVCLRCSGSGVPEKSSP